MPEREVHPQAGSAEGVKKQRSPGPCFPGSEVLKASTRLELHHAKSQEGQPQVPNSLKLHAWRPLLHQIRLLWTALAKTWVSVWLQLNPVATPHAELLVEVDC